MRFVRSKKRLHMYPCSTWMDLRMREEPKTMRGEPDDFWLYAPQIVIDYILRLMRINRPNGVHPSGAEQIINIKSITKTRAKMTHSWRRWRSRWWLHCQFPKRLAGVGLAKHVRGTEWRIQNTTGWIFLYRITQQPADIYRCIAAGCSLLIWAIGRQAESSIDGWELVLGPS